MLWYYFVFLEKHCVTVSPRLREAVAIVLLSVKCSCNQPLPLIDYCNVSINDPLPAHGQFSMKTLTPGVLCSVSVVLQCCWYPGGTLL